MTLDMPFNLVPDTFQNANKKLLSVQTWHHMVGNLDDKGSVNEFPFFSCHSSLQLCPVTEQRIMGTNWNAGRYVWSPFLWRWQNTKTEPRRGGVSFSGSITRLPECFTVTHYRELALWGGWTRGSPEVPFSSYSPVILRMKRTNPWNQII